MAEIHGGEPERQRLMLIAYGSETGNSQDVAEELGRITERLHFKTHVAELDAVRAVSPPYLYGSQPQSFIVAYSLVGRFTSL